MAVEDEGGLWLFSSRNTLAMIVPVLAYVGTRYERPILVALATMAFALLLILFFLGAWQISLVAVRRKVEGHGAFEDDPVDVCLLVINKGWLPVFPFALDDRFPPAELSFKRLVASAPLPARSVSRLFYAGRCVKRRGRYELGPVRIRTSDPLGLFVHERQLPVLEEFLVYPAPVEIARLALAGESTRAAARQVSGLHKGESQAFHGTREYRTGDELRRVHWPTTARRGRLVVAEHDREVARHLAIVVDLEASQRAGLGQKSVQEYAIKLAASVARHALGQRSIVELVVAAEVERVVRAGSGQRQLVRILASLVDVKQDGKVPLVTVLDRHLPRLPPDSQVALVTSSAAGDPDALAALAHRCRAIRRGRATKPLVLLLDHGSFLQLATPAATADATAHARALTLAGATVYLVGAAGPLALQLVAPWSEPAPPGPAIGGAAASVPGAAQ